MARRERGSGSISKRADGTYVGALALPKGARGERRRRFIYGETRADVKAELERLQTAAQVGTLTTHADRTTLGMYLRMWLAGKETSVRTHRQYAWLIESYLVPRIGARLLSELDGAAIDAFLRELRADNPGDRTRQLCYDVLRAALNRAVATKIIRGNPMTGSERPRVERRDVSPWLVDEAERVLAAARDDRFHALYVLELRLGLQFPGEVLGLRWDLDVDLKGRTIRVGGQLARGRRAQTKTAARRRELEMPDVVHAALTAHRERLFAEGLRSAPWVFPNGRGGPQSARNFVRDSFDKVVARAGVRRLRPYDMRHTFATLALSAGVHIKIVSRMLGHANEIETLRTYMHFIPSQMTNANAQIDAIWNVGSTLGSTDAIGEAGAENEKPAIPYRTRV